MNMGNGIGLQAIIDALPFYVLLVDEEHRILNANRAVITGLGLDPASIAGQYCPKAVHGLDTPFPGCPLEEAVAQGTAVEKEMFDEKHSRWLKSCIYPMDLLSGEGKRIYVHSVHDITEAKQAQTEMASSSKNQAMLNNLLRISLEDIALPEMLDRMLGAILSVSWLDILPKGAIFLVEERPERLILTAQKGLSPHLLESCRSVPFGKCLCGIAAVERKTVFKNHLDESHAITYEGILPHGHYCVPVMIGREILGVLNVYVSAGHLRSPREEEFLGAVASVIAGAVLHRKSEKEREEVTIQLRQSQKMESIGRLAGGVAHDFNNVLTVIGGYCEMLLGNLPAGDPSFRKIEAIKKSADHASSLTHQLLAFSRRQVLQPQPLDLNVIIGDLRMMLGRLIGEDIALEPRLAGDLGKIMADPGQITQVIMNLAVNARDAMPGGGTIIIETSNVDLDETYAGSHVSVVPGKYVMLVIKDNGIGMDQETQAHIFEPFFTTKETGKGTGLGLSMVFGIVKQSGGNIWVYSEPGKGTMFRIYMPRMGGDAESAGQKAGETRETRGSEAILVAEDQIDVRELVCEVLRSKGYRVLEAQNGASAAALGERHAEPIELLVTDLVMPGIGGQELAEMIRGKRPVIKVLYMSGYTERATFQPAILRRHEAFIQKPFGPEALARKVREVLDAPEDQPVSKSARGNKAGKVNGERT